MNDIALVIPEIALLVFGCAVLLLEAFVGKRKPLASFWCSMLGGIVVLALLASYVPESARFGFAGTFRVDVVGTVLKSFMIVLVLLSFFYAREYYAKREQSHGEHYSLAMFATLGMLILVSANSLLTVYLGLELLSLSMYAMVATQRDSPTASVSAMTYFVLAAHATC
ncbi:MAG: proton-conducting transporter membrane subunit [Gammaproteobacteria bacterium]